MHGIYRSGGLMALPLVAFRLEDDAELEAIRAIAAERTEGNVSRLIREALRAQYAELATLAQERRPT